MRLTRLFVEMALLFPWATKEYLLWEMSLGQIIAYYNIAVGIKNNKGGNTLKDMTYQQLKKKRDEMIKQGLIPKKEDVEKIKDEYRKKFGDI